MTKSFYPPAKINLVEHDEWKEYDPTDKMGDYAFQNAMDAVSHMSLQEVVGLAEDVLGAGRRKAVGMTSTQAEAFWEAYDANKDSLTLFHQLIQDAMTSAYQEAYTPTDADITRAIDLAVDEVANDQDWLYGHDDLYEVRNKLGYDSSKGFVKDLLYQSVYLKRKPGYYDRHLIYAPPSEELLERMKKVQGVQRFAGVLEWYPAVDILKDPHIVKEFTDLFNEIKPDIVRKTFNELVTHMRKIDLENRFDFTSQWKSMLKDPSRIREARQAIVDFLATVPEED